MKVCTVCRQSKSLDKFYYQATGSQNRTGRCKACIAEAAKTRRQKIVDKYPKFRDSKGNLIQLDFHPTEAVAGTRGYEELRKLQNNL